MSRPASINQTDWQRIKAERRRRDRERYPARQDAAKARVREARAARDAKPCTECGKVVAIEGFLVHGKGRLNRCMACYSASFVSKASPTRKPPRPLTPEQRAKKSLRDRIWRDANRTRIAATKKVRRHSRPDLQLRGRMARAVRRALAGAKNGGKTFALLGYSLNELRTHLERQFLKGMSWENIGEWHIDHIVPLSSFEITNAQCDGFRRAWALTNLRPLWAGENVRKSSKREFLI